MVTMQRGQLGYGLWGRALWVGLFAIIIILPLIIQRPFFHHVIIMLALYAMMGEAWNIVGGYLGYVSFGHAVFFGIGAYTTAVLFTNFNVNPWAGMVIGGVVAVGAAAIIAYPCFRFGLRGHYFAIATMAFGEIVRVLFLNWPYVGGATGFMVPLHKDSFALLQFHQSKLPYYYITLVLVVTTLLIIRLIINSKLGYYLRAIREDEEAAECLGVPTSLIKHAAFYISALIVALAGALYGQYQLYFDPPMVFDLMVSVNMALITIFGGRGTIAGPLLGAAIFVPLREYARAWLGGGGRGLDYMVLGLLLMVIVVSQPKGVLGLLDRIVRRKAYEKG